jgi:hypothetical protein
MLIMGLTFKELSLAMLLVGSVSVMLLTLIIPAALYLQLHKVKNITLPNAGRFRLAMVCSIIASGFASVVGVITAIRELIK